MCRPVNVSRAEACPGGHIGPPLRGAGAFRSNGNRCETEPFPNGAGRSPPLSKTRGAKPGNKVLRFAVKAVLVA